MYLLQLYFFYQNYLLQCIHLSHDYSMSLCLVWLSLQNKWRTFIRNGMFSTNNKNYKLIKTISGNIQGPGSIQKHCLIRIGIHIVEIWWSSDYLISSMSIPFLISQLSIESQLRSVKRLSYQHRTSHWGDKMIRRPSYLLDVNSYSDKPTFYWIPSQVTLGSTPLPEVALGDSTRSISY